jgi:sporulation protein YlmC with PRC-barrel domain
VRTFSSLLGRMVVTESGREFGRCRDVRARIGRSDAVVEGLVVGRAGLFEHLGIGGSAEHGRDLVPWDAVLRIDAGRIVVRDGTEAR